MTGARRQLVIFLAILLLYLTFLTRTYYWDGVLFALNIEAVERHGVPFTALFHPNHLLYSAFGYVLYSAALALRLSLRAMAVLQIANAVVSAISGVVLFSIARRITGSIAIALFCCILFAFGATWWKFSTDADPYILAILLILLAIRFLLESRPRLIPAAACHTIAMLFHELSIFVYVPVLVAIAIDGRWSKTKKTWLAGCYVGATAICVGVVYLACYVRTDRAAYPSPLAWITSYASNSGFTRSWNQLVSSYLASYIKLVGGGRVRLISEYFSIPVCLALVISFGALLWAVWAFWRSREAPAINLNRKPMIVLWAWLLPEALFLASWDPGSAFHKLFVWPAIVLLIGWYVASHTPLRARGDAFVALAIAIAAWNFGAFIYPHSHSSADPVLVLAETIDQQLPKNATVYYRALDADDWYLEYFAPGRTWLPLPRGVDDFQRLTDSALGTVCLETTAIELFQEPSDPVRKWELVNRGHNVRLACWSKPR
jgi:hypothetical protein